MNTTSNQLLKTALVSNAAFSFVSGITLIILNTNFQTWFGLHFPFWLIGAGLIPFAWFGYQTSRNAQNMVQRSQIITFMDVLWVLASIAVILLIDMTLTGQWIVGVIALIVGDFAFFQWLGVKRINNGQWTIDNGQLTMPKIG